MQETCTFDWLDISRLLMHRRACGKKTFCSQQISVELAKLDKDLEPLDSLG